MLAFYKRHKISVTIVLIVLVLILYMVIKTQAYHVQKWKNMYPLNALLEEKFSSDDFRFDHVDVSDDGQIYLIHVVVSEEKKNSDDFLVNCHEIVKMISEHAKQHPGQFALKSESPFYLTFNDEEYEYTENNDRHCLLELSNWYSYEIEWKHEWKDVYCDEFVSLWVRCGINNISVFEELINLGMWVTIEEYPDMIEEVIKMPNLKFIDVGNGDSLPLEEKKKYAAKLHENGINSSLWQSLYG